MPKRIILLLDGTWNDADFGDSDTNIVRIRDIIAKTLWAENDAYLPIIDWDGFPLDPKTQNGRATALQYLASISMSA